eukprot:1157205-Pelagomonas_calceolata.AAC.10
MGPGILLLSNVDLCHTHLISINLSLPLSTCYCHPSNVGLCHTHLISVTAAINLSLSPESCQPLPRPPERRQPVTVTVT